MKDILEILPQRLAKMEIIRTQWQPRSNNSYDFFLSARARAERGLNWIFECREHNKMFFLAGAPATVHGSWKRNRHQGVVKLPDEHRSCPYTIWTEPEWEVVVPTSLSEIIQPPVVYRIGGWMVTVGGLDSITLSSQKDDWTAVLELWPRTRQAELCIRFANIPDATTTFSWEYDEAARLFLQLLEAGEIPSAEPSLEARFAHLAKFVDPREVVPLIEIS
jgi:hypothetical protein